MAFKHAEFNSTRQVEEKGSWLTGRPEAIWVRNKYQTELDNSHSAVVNMVHYCEEKNEELKSAYNFAQGIKRNIDAHMSERASAFDSLNNLLNKETKFEEGMWKTTQKGRKVKSITVKQKFKESDVDEMRFDSMLEYLKQYPEYASKSSFRKILDKIEEKEREIRHAKQEYHKAVSNYNHLLSMFATYIQKAQDKIDVYEKILTEGEKKLASTRYVKSVFFKLASEKTKSEVTLDTLQHRIKQFSNTLDLIKKDHAQNKGKEFVEMEY